MGMLPRGRWSGERGFSAEGHRYKRNFGIGAAIASVACSDTTLVFSKQIGEALEQPQAGVVIVSVLAQIGGVASSLGLASGEHRMMRAYEEDIKEGAMSYERSGAQA